jgi:hypothetical protein
LIYVADHLRFRALLRFIARWCVEQQAEHLQLALDNYFSLLAQHERDGREWVDLAKGLTL